MTDTRFAVAAGDAAVLVVNSIRGIESNSRKLAKLARAAGLPLAIFVNGEDLEQAKDFTSCSADPGHHRPARGAARVPIGKSSDFRGDVDLIGIMPGTSRPTRHGKERPRASCSTWPRYHQPGRARGEPRRYLERYLGGRERRAAPPCARTSWRAR
jgi:peptide subunit release factor RF-3